MDNPIDPALRYPLYHAVRDEIQTGDLMEWRTVNSILAEGICTVTGKDVNHSAMFARSVIPGHPDRIFIIGAEADGVIPTLFTERLAGHRGPVYWYSLKATQQQRMDMLYFAMTMVGQRKNYDVEDLLNQLVRTVSINLSSLFCSEFYQAAMMMAGLIPMTETTAKRPGELIDYGLHKRRVQVYWQ